MQFRFSKSAAKSFLPVSAKHLSWLTFYTPYSTYYHQNPAAMEAIFTILLWFIGVTAMVLVAGISLPTIIHSEKIAGIYTKPQIAYSLPGNNYTSYHTSISCHYLTVNQRDITVIK